MQEAVEKSGQDRDRGVGGFDIDAIDSSGLFDGWMKE